METIKTEAEWINNLIPEGILKNSSTVITGPGGSGKPLIGDHFIAHWLKNGGNVIFMSLQYPDNKFIYASLSKVAGLDLTQYEEEAFFIKLDPSISGVQKGKGNHLSANLVKPENWDEAIKTASESFANKGADKMVFGSALNLLLFSPTYEMDILDKIIGTVKNDKSKTYLFSVSTSAKKKQIERLEQSADNLIMTRSTKDPFKLFMNVIRVKDLPYNTEEIEVPIPKGALEEVKEVAEDSRKRIIPAISRI